MGWRGEIGRYVLLITLSFGVYSNSLYGEWVFDDVVAVFPPQPLYVCWVQSTNVHPRLHSPTRGWIRKAATGAECDSGRWPSCMQILRNKDVLPSTPWEDLWHHDFWGNNIDDWQSHKSFRPVTIASFRLNYIMAGEVCRKHARSAWVVLRLTCPSCTEVRRVFLPHRKRSAPRPRRSPLPSSFQVTPCLPGLPRGNCPRCIRSVCDAPDPHGRCQLDREPRRAALGRHVHPIPPKLHRPLLSAEHTAGMGARCSLPHASPTGVGCPGFHRAALQGACNHGRGRSGGTKHNLHDVTPQRCRTISLWLPCRASPSLCLSTHAQEGRCSNARGHLQRVNVP